jgi:uncharacterized membrane protein
MKPLRALSMLLAGAVTLGGTVVQTDLPAQADTASTAAIIAGAAAIVGALLIDGNNRPYYVKGGKRYYVTQAEANTWKQRHHVVVRQAYVPEREYPVARDPYHGNQQKHR